MRDYRRSGQTYRIFLYLFAIWGSFILELLLDFLKICDESLRRGYAVYYPLPEERVQVIVITLTHTAYI
jgi:hypothetical protein